MVFHLCPHVQFPSRNIFSHDVLLNLMEKTKHAYRSGKGIHLLIIILGQGEKLETKLGMQGEMEK